MVEKIDESSQNQIYQSFTKNNFENSQNLNISSIKKESEEFTFKKIISESNKSTGTEKEQDIYSKNDENIQQSGHFYNEIKEDLKNKELINNIKGKNIILKPLLKFISKKKIEFQKLKLNKINTKFFFRKNLNVLKNSKKNLIICDYFTHDLKININRNISNITTINNSNNKNCLSYLSKSPVNTFLEISHDSNYENNENKNTNENKENYNTTNTVKNKNKFKNKFNINRKTFNDIKLNKSAEKKLLKISKSRNRPKIKNIKKENNISFELLKNEYKELKQKIFENKINKIVHKTNKGKIKNVTNIIINHNKKINSNKNLLFKPNINLKKNLNSISCLKRNKKRFIFKNIKNSKFTFVPKNDNEKKSHRRLKSSSSDIQI